MSNNKGLVLNQDVLSWIDEHKGIKSRNAFLVVLVRHYIKLAKAGAIDVPSFPEGGQHERALH